MGLTNSSVPITSSGSMQEPEDFILSRAGVGYLVPLYSDKGLQSHVRQCSGKYSGLHPAGLRTAIESDHLKVMDTFEKS